MGCLFFFAYRFYFLWFFWQIFRRKFLYSVLNTNILEHLGILKRSQFWLSFILFFICLLFAVQFVGQNLDCGTVFKELAAPRQTACFMLCNIEVIIRETQKRPPIYHSFIIKYCNSHSLRKCSIAINL